MTAHVTEHGPPEGAKHRAHHPRWRELLPAPATSDPAGSQFALFRQHLRDRHFWIVQLMIAIVTFGHIGIELVEPNDLGAVYFIPGSLYVFPVIYASLNFGKEGAVPTAIWSALLAVPNVVLWHHGLEAVGESFQVATMLLLGTVVALRVDRESVARRLAERAESQRRSSELKYRSLFDGAGEPILVVDGSGLILEANAAADLLAGRGVGKLTNVPLSDLFGTDATAVLEAMAGPSQDLPDVSIKRLDGVEVWLQPIAAPVPSADGRSLMQVLLRDVTDRHGFEFYAQQVVKAQESERQRIAQELHDVSVQSAILICRRLDAAAEAVQVGQRKDVVRALDQARQTAENMADELRRFSRDLRPVILEDLGLALSLKRLLIELRERTGIRVRFDSSGPERRLDPTAELALFRIGQECVSNIERHSRATNASIRLDFKPQTVCLTVTDDGEGFSVPQLTALSNEGRLGLLGMHERARLVGGHCDIHSEIGAGTRVVTEIPAAAK